MPEPALVIASYVSAVAQLFPPSAWDAEAERLAAVIRDGNALTVARMLIEEFGVTGVDKDSWINASAGEARDTANRAAIAFLDKVGTAYAHLRDEHENGRP